MRDRAISRYIYDVTNVRGLCGKSTFAMPRPNPADGSTSLRSTGRVKSMTLKKLDASLAFTRSQRKQPTPAQAFVGVLAGTAVFGKLGCRHFWQAGLPGENFARLQ